MTRYSEKIVDNLYNLEDFLFTVRTFSNYDEILKKHNNIQDLIELAKSFVYSDKPIGFWGTKQAKLEEAYSAHILALNMAQQKLPVGFGYLEELVIVLSSLEISSLNNPEDIDLVNKKFSYGNIEKSWNDVRHLRGSLQARISKD
jgi:hypothetical protein